MIFEMLQFPLTLCGDEHNKNEHAQRTTELYGILEDLGKPVIHLGDLFHTKEKVSSKIFNHVYSLLKNSKLDHIILVGNHDWHSLECEGHSLEVLKDLPNVMVVDKPTRIRLEDPNLEQSTSALFVPYIHDLNKFKAALSGGADVLFMHQGVTGFDYGNGYIAKDELDQKSLARFKQVYSGHFHKYQRKGNLTFLGTPYSNDFGESNQEKYLGTLLSNLELELTLMDFPSHMTTTVDCSGHPLEAQLSKEETRPGYSRIILTGKKEDIELFPKENYPGVKFIERPVQTIQALELTGALSNEAKFQLWSKNRLESDTEKLGLEILQSVKV